MILLIDYNIFVNKNLKVSHFIQYAALCVSVLVLTPLRHEPVTLVPIVEHTAGTRMCVPSSTIWDRPKWAYASTFRC